MITIKNSSYTGEGGIFILLDRKYFVIYCSKIFKEILTDRNRGFQNILHLKVHLFTQLVYHYIYKKIQFFIFT